MNEDQIKAATTAELIALYNKLTNKNIKKFSSRATGETQLTKLLKANEPKEPSETPSKKIVSNVGKRQSYESRKIDVQLTENPKREGSRAHKKFDVLMKFSGKTIAEFKAEEGKHPSLDDEAGWPATELRWALKMSHVKLIPPLEAKKAA